MFVMIDIWILPFSLIGPSNQLNIDTFILKSKNKKKKENGEIINNRYASKCNMSMVDFDVYFIMMVQRCIC